MSEFIAQQLAAKNFINGYQKESAVEAAVSEETIKNYLFPGVSPFTCAQSKHTYDLNWGTGAI